MFQIHPSDLERRRKRCAHVTEKLSKYERAPTDKCNVCGSRQAAILSTCDRYGFPGRSALCLECGLIYNLDRFTARGYADFYEHGAYRDLIGKFKNLEQSLERVHAGQVSYAANLLRTFEGLIPQNPKGKLLDIGGSTGLVAQAFQQRLGYRPTIIEPSAGEVAKARSLGLEAEVGSIETWATNEKFDLILLCRTVEHLYDLSLALKRIRTLLKPGGLFYCDIAEFLEIVRREGPPEATTKIDHVFWLTQETASVIFASFGFELVSMQLTLPPDQVGFLWLAAEPRPLHPRSPEWVQGTLRFFRQVKTDWLRYGAQPVDAKDWLHQRAYRLKKRLIS